MLCSEQAPCTMYLWCFFSRLFPVLSEFILPHTNITLKILDYFGCRVSGGHGPLGRPLRILMCEATPLCHWLQLAGGVIMCLAPCHPPPRMTQS